MQALHEARIPFIVAPFEADAQMVWMCKAGMAAAIITEDSDVLVYCAAANVDCPVLFKLDEGGMTQALSREILHHATASTDNMFLKKIHLLTTGDKDATRMFVQFCALAGCDFLDSLPKMGIVTALKHVYSFRGAPANVRVQRLLAKLSANGTKVPPTFHAQFQKTESVFFHHIVFNLHAQRCEFLIDDAHANCHADIYARVKETVGVRGSGECLHSVAKPSTRSYLGDIPPRETMLAIAKGQLCSRTKKPVGGHTHNDCQQEDVALPSPPSQSTSLDSFSVSPPPSPVPKRLPVRKPVVVDPVAEERRQTQRAQQRDASMRSLLNAYSAKEESSRQAPPDRIPPTAAVSVTPSRKRSMEVVTAAPTAVFSMKELAQRHARADTIVSVPPSRTSPFFEPRNATEAAKKRKLGMESSAPAASSSVPAPKTSTLHHFFGRK